MVFKRFPLKKHSSFKDLNAFRPNFREKKVHVLNFFSKFFFQVLRQRNLRTTVIGEITNHLETIGMENENANTAQVQANTTSLPKSTDVNVISWPLLYLCKQTKLFNCLSTFVLRNLFVKI